MRKMKKLASLMLALVMVFSMAMTVTAAKGTNSDDGEITIENAVKGQTYTIYEILKLESYDTEKGNGAYSYKATDDWSTFINREDIKGTYVEVDAQGYVTWKTGASASDFAELAKTYAKGLGNNQGQVEATSGTVEFTNLNLGYYLVDSTLGAVCSLDTTNPTVTIKEKNGKPTVDKKVEENSTWGTQNDASIGDTVNYKTTINAIDGDPTNYVLHDKMSEGLTFDSTSVKVTVNGVDSKTGWTLKTEGLTDECTFEISFADVNPNDVIVVTYSAVLNEKAVIYENKNTNDTWLSYGNEGETEKAHTDTYTYKFDLVKTDSSNKVLKGAEFKLYDAQTGGNEIKLVEESEGVYRVDASGSATIKAGQVIIKGLDSGTYWLEETKAPEGFNKLDKRVEVKIENDNLVATVNGDTWTKGGVHVINKTGTELPSTGGMGTTVFYVLGSILVIGAAVLLITRRRMSK